MTEIAKTIKEELPETAEGLREYIRLAEKESLKLSKRIHAARELLMVKEKGGRRW